MAINYKAYVDANGDVYRFLDGSADDVIYAADPNATRIPALDLVTSNDNLTNESVVPAHNHVAADITDFDTAVSANADVTANTAKRSYPIADENKLATIEANAKDDQNAAEVPCDTTGTQFIATNVQDFIVEIDAWVAPGGGLDHGGLVGLADDDHTQYHNDARGDIRYYTKTLLDGGQLDNRYYTETELNAGALDVRYYTETEVNTLLNNYQLLSQKNVANGYAGLDGNAKIPIALLPALAISETFVVADITARDALTIGSGDGEVQTGDVAIVNDASADPNVDAGGASYIWDGTQWQRMQTPQDAILSVNGQTGVVNLTTSNIPEGTNLYYTETRVSNNVDVSANTAHRNVTAGNPHNTTITQAITADAGTDITTAELEQLTDGSDAGALHNHNGVYYTQAQLNAGQLNTLYYTKTELDAGQLDNRYFTESELTSGALDGRYYTQTQLDAGQLDNRYYTETEIDAQQLIQDNAIALNTAKVSADGSISTHSDVDLTGIASGDILQWNGTNFAPQTIGNEYTLFPIWAEENGNANPATSGGNQWSFGNGAVGTMGIPVAIDCQTFAMSFNAETFGTSVDVALVVNGVVATTVQFTSNNQIINFPAINLNSGDVVGFRTTATVGTSNDCRVVAWQRVPASAAFPTPDISVVNNSSVNFTSTTFANIPGMTTSVALTNDGKIDATVTYSAARSGGVNSEAQFRVVINGNNGQIFNDTLSTFNDTGAVSHFVNGLPAGNYTVSAQAAVDQPIDIASIQLRATAVED